MKIAGYGINDATIINNGINDETEFGIAINAKSFKVLSSTLYQNKIGSIVREISSNARDSHIAKGTPEIPFEIHAPSLFEPYFSVRDFGVGLTDEDIRTIYTRLFVSTKDNSNDQVGAFGLGSKTPLSYTDSFTVTSIFNGIKRIYSIYIKNNGMPAINLMANDKTDEQNGVEVSIAVETNDISRFCTEISKQLRFFSVKPIIKNSTNFKFESIGTPFISIDRFDITSTGKINIIQGDIGYPLDVELISPKITDRNLSEFLEKIEERGANIYFDIGEIDITPSREAISYENNTINTIIKRFEKTLLLFKETMQKTLNSLQNDWERAIFLNEGTAFISSSILESNQFGLVYSNDTGMVGYSSSRLSISDEFDINVNNYKLVTPKYSDKYVVKRGRVNSFLYPRNNTKVFIVDEEGKRYYNQRVRKYIIENNIKETFYIVKIDSSNRIDSSVISQLESKITGIKFIKCSTLPLPKKYLKQKTLSDTKRAGQSYLKSRYYKYSGEDLSLMRLTSYEKIYTPLKDAEGGYYIPVKSGVFASYDKLSNLLSLIKINLIDKNKIYAIREQDLKKIQSNNKWKNIYDEADRLFEQLNQDKRLVRKMAYCAARKEYSRRRVYTEIPKIKNPLIEKFKRLNSYNDAYSSHHLEQLYKEMDGDYYNHIKNSFIKKFKSFSNMIQEKYPLLFVLEFQKYERSIHKNKIDEILEMYTNC